MSTKKIPHNSINRKDSFHQNNVFPQHINGLIESYNYKDSQLVHMNSDWTLRNSHIVDTSDHSIYNDHYIPEEYRRDFLILQADYFDLKLKELVLKKDYKLNPSRQYILSIKTLNNSGDIVINCKYIINNQIISSYYIYYTDQNIIDDYISFRDLIDANIQFYRNKKYKYLRTNEFMILERIFFMNRRILTIWIKSNCPTVIQYMAGFHESYNTTYVNNRKIFKIINIIYNIHNKDIIETMLAIKNLIITNSQTNLEYTLYQDDKI